MSLKTQSPEMSKVTTTDAIASHPAMANAKAHLGALIGFDTVSHRSNRDLIDHMAAHVKALGAEVTLLPDATGEKVNLVARFGPADVAGVVLSGHTDVVPALEETWTTHCCACHVFEFLLAVTEVNVYLTVRYFVWSEEEMMTLVEFRRQLAWALIKNPEWVGEQEELRRSKRH